MLNVLAGCSGSTPFLGAAESKPRQNCEAIADPLDKSICRQAHLRDTAQDYITLGMLIGAAIGAASAPLLRVNPLTGAIIGAALGGAATATERYLSYRLEQARGDMAAALQDVKRDVRVDVERGNIIETDLQFALVSTKQTLADHSKALAAQSNMLEKIHAVVKEASLNAKTYKTAVEVYGELQHQTPLGSDTEYNKDYKSCVECASKLEQHDIEYRRFLRDLNR